MADNTDNSKNEVEIDLDKYMALIEKLDEQEDVIKEMKEDAIKAEEKAKADAKAAEEKAKAAKEAEEAFEKTFAKGGVPEDVMEVKLRSGDSLAETLIKFGVVPSKTEWRRLVDGGAVRDE